MGEKFRRPFCGQDGTKIGHSESRSGPTARLYCVALIRHINDRVLDQGSTS